MAQCSSIEAIEAKAMIFGLRYAGVRSIILEGDCAVVLSGIKNNGMEFSEAGDFISEIQRLITEFAHVGISIIHRSANAVAHLKANWGRQQVDEHCWNSLPPDFLSPGRLYGLSLNFPSVIV